VGEVWTSGAAYERYMGRWSRLVALEFLDWLGAPDGLRWADVGCGTGALTEAILERCSPAAVVALDPSRAQVEGAARAVRDDRVSFGVGTAQQLPVSSCDLVVSGLVLNFLPEPLADVVAMGRAAPGGTVAGYVWDYAEGMELLRTFWKIVCSLDPAAAGVDERRRFPLCTPPALVSLWERAGFGAVRTTATTVPMVFPTFDDLWSPFLGGQGPAPAYVAALGPSARDTLRQALAAALPSGPGGRIELTARAWAVRGTPP
jgi:SAM-dependent methyltransferase